MTIRESSTGGRIIALQGGLIHTANSERFVNAANADLDRPTNNVGRPTKASVEHGLQFDFSQFLTPVKLSAAAGVVVRFC